LLNKLGINANYISICPDKFLYLFMQKFNSLIQLLDHFKDENTCQEYLAKQRWGDTVTCPHCKHNKVYVTNRGYKCASPTCYKKFSVTTGTIYENTKIPLRTWFAAMYLLTAHKKGISSHQLGRDLNITQRTAWFVLHRIREMLKEKNPKALNGVVEADETYVGGKNKYRRFSKKIKGSQGRSPKDKIPVVGLVERNGKVITFATDDTDQVTLHTIVTSNVDFGSKLITDAHHSYNGLGEFYNHTVVKHGIGEKKYITKGEDHTNTIEGYWSLFKRMYVGTYHCMSRKHLQRYCDEMSYRYNSRQSKDCFRFEEAIGQADNARITYKQLIGKPITLGDGKKGKEIGQAV
jgi:transposase-like protein